jgi:pimeloyl-ACP methyl ester carboxylesterase
LNSDGSSGQHWEQLVNTHAADGLLLDGALFGKPGGNPSELAIVLIHGGLSNFYGRAYVELGRSLAQLGYQFISGNTRGHDAYALIEGREGKDDLVPGGSCFEDFEQSIHDIRGWLDYAEGLGTNGIVLAGHSHAVPKILNYQIEHDDIRVKAMIAASPTGRDRTPPARLAMAQALKAEGRGLELMPHLEGTPSWNLISAQTVASRAALIGRVFGSHLQTSSVERIRRPILILSGDRDPVDTDSLAAINDTSEVAHIPDAGHDFRGQEQVAAGLIDRWLRKQALA